ncbi:methyltransferase regulatory domain-containing protein [Candidatus Symbiopectobacterium sp.]|uniref:O-linked N-acetylglucosamine transferase family protein n=1 Tax=Candidatus Symbiopectobacterium sp. TaxID=2816440 RepID=UPI0025B93200|nr:methyltransferase regulatory domain-containing protein [Candidatus Symbiopectobacterium sp.]
MQDNSVDPVNVSDETVHRPQIETSYASPVHIKAAAYLYGIHTPAVEKARVLELGCGAGDNILPFVLAYEKSQAVGIDLDDALISQGQHALRTMSVPNLQLATADIDELLNSELGEFDYIIIHGHFSTINNAMRSALLEWVKLHLTPKGIACLAWSTYPGYKVAEVLQDALQLHSSLAQTPAEQLDDARAMLTFMSLGLAAKNTLSEPMRELVKHAETSSDLALSLRYLQCLNEPCYLLDFHAMAAGAGFAYVGDLLPHTEIAGHYGGDVEKLHNAICPGDNKLLGQQYLDFAVGRSHRFSLLVTEQRAKDILPTPDLARLTHFHWAGSFQRGVTNEGHVANAHYSGSGVVVHINHDLALNMMDVISDAWPHSVSFDQLVFNTRAPEYDKEDKQHQQDVLDALTMLFRSGIDGLHFSQEQGRYNSSSSTSVQLLPCVAALLRDNVPAHTAIGVFNLWHDKIMFTFTQQEQDYLRLLLCQKSDLPLDADCYEFMERLRIAGVLWGSVPAWQHYFQQLLQACSSKSERYLGALIMYCSETSVGGYISPDSEKVKKSHHSKRVADARPVDKTIQQQIRYLISINDYAAARSKAKALVEEMPSNVYCWYLLGQTNLKTGAYDEGLAALMKTLSMHATSWSVYQDAAYAFWYSYRHYYAGRLVRKILRCDHRNAGAWNMLSTLYKDSNEMAQAEFCVRKAEQYAPEEPNILNNLANLLSSQGRMSEAVDCFRRMRAIAPDHCDLYSSYLFTLLHDVRETPESLYAEHRGYGVLVEQRAQQYHRHFIPKGTREPGRKLRVGFVSGDLCNHQVANFLRPIWESINREYFALYGFASSNNYDNITQSFEQTADGWHAVYRKSDIELAELIHEEQIDILFDLSGHTACNRLPMFAFKPAPIQISWIGCPGTTGMSAMDYFLIFNLAPGTKNFQQQFVEKLVYLRSELQFKSVNNSPEVNELPAIKRGRFTFASMNRIQKLNDYMCDAWVQIIKSVPDSRMIIAGLSGKQDIAILRAKFDSYGIASSQLVFHERLSLSKYLELHHEIDLLLDTYPYSGGTTTNYALWMGVPTLMLTGENYHTWQGVAALNALGLEGFVASSKQEYIEQAISWSTRLDELNQCRQALRPRFMAIEKQGGSPSLYFEQMMRSVWMNYCDGKPAQACAFGC